MLLSSTTFLLVCERRIIYVCGKIELKGYAILKSPEVEGVLQCVLKIKKSVIAKPCKKIYKWLCKVGYFAHPEVLKEELRYFKKRELSEWEKELVSYAKTAGAKRILLPANPNKKIKITEKNLVKLAHHIIFAGPQLFGTFNREYVGVIFCKKYGRDYLRHRTIKFDRIQLGVLAAKGTADTVRLDLEPYFLLMRMLDCDYIAVVHNHIPRNYETWKYYHPALLYPTVLDRQALGDFANRYKNIEFVGINVGTGAWLNHYYYCIWSPRNSIVKGGCGGPGYRYTVRYHSILKDRKRYVLIE